ncbi:MBL fold metallo-hydrolase [Algoriphagus sediminis]|uniref:MBL fold metallo-hydrolase n=1 Tax=Algoriphagus sediminis TaxID=3057113 RepID=A0ABT7Y8D8_9BACT|nr:MBL fold metallo-hydrolase [Algoriphagus sediminis]MDN3202774.1 MBL fold metallo-hydrolase [Algoriphagus sediminis]
MIKAYQKDEELFQDILKTKNNHSGLRVWWLGQSGFLVQWNGIHVLFDPYLSDSLTKKYENTEKPHVRMSEKAIDPEKLDFIDVVTSSHYHTDHLDAETLKPILRQKKDIKFIIPEANRSFVSERVDCAPNFALGMTDGTEISFSEEVKITALASAHNELEKDEFGNNKFLGFILNIGPYTLYHSGDTLWYEGLEEKVKAFAPDVLFLPINGNRPERMVAGNMSAEEAAKFGKVVNSGIVIPHHFHMFEFNTEDPDSFAKYAQVHHTKYQILKIGQSFKLD